MKVCFTPTKSALWVVPDTNSEAKLKEAVKKAVNNERMPRNYEIFTVDEAIQKFSESTSTIALTEDGKRLSTPRLRDLKQQASSGKGNAPSASTVGSPEPPSNRNGLLPPWVLIEKLLEADAVRVLHIAGPPGIGKTWVAQNIGLNGRQVENTTFNEESDPALEVWGCYFPSDDGNFRFHEGAGTHSARNGLRLVLNEVRNANPAVISALYGLLERPDAARIRLPNGETLVPDNRFQVIITDNGTIEDLPAAVQSRIETSIYVDEPYHGSLNALPDDLAKAAKAKAHGFDLRAWFDYAEKRQLLDEKVAAQAVFGERALDVMQSLALGR